MFGANGSDIAWLVIAGISAWTVLMCLKVISFSIDHAVAMHRLATEVKALRAARLKRRMIPTAEIVDLASEPRLGLQQRKTAAAEAAPGAEAEWSGDTVTEVTEAGEFEVPENAAAQVTAAKAA